MGGKETNLISYKIEGRLIQNRTYPKYLSPRHFISNPLYRPRGLIGAAPARPSGGRADLTTLPTTTTPYPIPQPVSGFVLGPNPLDTQARIDRLGAYPAVRGPSQDVRLRRMS